MSNCCQTCRVFQCECSIDVATAVERMKETLAELPDDESRQEALKKLTENRCPKCFDYDKDGNFWCCYESREYPD